MKNKILFGIQFFILLSIVFIGNGNFSPFSKPVPPPIRFLDPWKGVWNHGVRQTKEVLLTSSSLLQPATIVYDKRWVPHIYAENLEDLLFLQGYVEAQNRLFQMEFLSMAAAGELSSILGEATLSYDLDKRRRGMKFAAENAVKAWEKMPEYALAQRYIDGVNEYIKQLSPEDYPLEYKLFNIKPQPWTALKSALIFKEMSLVLCGKNSDLPSTNAKNLLDSTTFARWYPEFESKEYPVVPEHITYNFDSIYVKDYDPGQIIGKVIENSFLEPRNPGIGSNQWTVGGQKTQSKANMFCNDPHLNLGLPSIWLEQHLISPQTNAYGVSFPGFPGIMIGFNDYIAWGETNVGQDVEDLFLVDWADAAKKQYYLDGNTLETKERIEVIEVKGYAKPVIDTVRYVHFGPVYKTSIDGKSDLAMRWLAHDAPSGPEFMTFVQAMQCKNYAEYQKATGVFETPAQNFGFSSKDGTIAIRVNGKLPAKSDQDGRFIESGNKASNDWQAFIPREQNPEVINPAEGFVASANQRSAGLNYPYYYTGTFEHYRNKTIHNFLVRGNGFTVQDMQKMQMNAYSSKAAGFISVLPEKCKPVMSKGKTAWYQRLKQWNSVYDRNAQEPVFFEIYVKHLKERTFDEFKAVMDKVQILLPKDWVLLQMIQQNPNDEIFNIKRTSTIENAENVQISAFFSAVQEMDSLLEANPTITWGKYKPLHINHLVRIPALSALDIEADGCPDAINAKGNSFGPSWRMIVHQTSPVQGYGVYPGGQSGNPFSPFYKNMVHDWVNGKYHQLRNDAKPLSIQDIAMTTITCKPR